MSHRCHAKGCPKEVPPRLLMCGKHWGMVPLNLQRAVWRTYVRGQEIRKDPTPSYLAAADAAIEVVAAKETQASASRGGADMARRLVRCRSCRAPIFWAYTTKKERIPIDPQMTLEGNIELTERADGELDARVVEPLLRAGKALHVAHFVNCPNAAEHRQGRAR